MIRFTQELIENLPDWGPQRFAAALQTLQLTFASFFFAIRAGAVVALAPPSRFPDLRWVSILSIELGRGPPALVIHFIIYFGLPPAVPQLEFDSLTAAVIGLGL